MTPTEQQAWRQRLVVLAHEHRLRQFEIADCLVLGIEQFGATAAYDCAEAVFPQYARATFQSWVTVAKHFPASIRIESDWLTFGHYQVAQGAESDPWSKDSNSKLQVAQELVWLRKADEHKMSVSALRENIAHAFELRHEAFLAEHPESKPEPVEPEPKPEPRKAGKDAFGSEIKEFKTPWLSKQTRFHLDNLARARRVTTEQLLNRVIQDFLDAHNDEIGNAEIAAKKRAAEHDAAMDAAQAAEKVKREADEQYRRKLHERAEKERAEKAEREQQAEVEREQRRQKYFLMQALTDEWKEVAA